MPSKPGVGAVKPSDLIPSESREATKTYSVYDGSGRLTAYYITTIETLDGEDCLKTEYEYDGDTHRVVKTKESRASWDETWDI